ncbi:MAG: shikimate dehydrogenase [Gammaproteobacteria bacterium]|jgi:shikimate dehydrogenase
MVVRQQVKPTPVNPTDQYGVVGHPVKHSLSPRIHTLFAEQTEQQLEYQAKELFLKDFEGQVRKLQEAGYRGLNVTVPFKQQAYEICDERSPRANDAGAVNTLIFQDDGTIAGDNTDGVGLTRDLITNHRVLIQRRKVLILGAGGAVRGVIAPLQILEPASITIANRTLEKAEKLEEDFGRPDSQVLACRYDDLGEQKFDLIINGTAAGLTHQVAPVPDAVLGINSICYDMMYNIEGNTDFVDWAVNLGASRTFDGLGMLIEQAAESFFIWRGTRPDTRPVISQLRQS